MGFNFPNAPTIGELFPASPGVGVPQYQWNGSEWVTPAYDPLNYVLKSGDTMLGALNVVTPPTQAAHAASKSYVDAYAAPLDALSYSGMQVNGSMEVSQEKGAAATTTNSAYICDGWKLQFSGTAAVSASSPGSSAHNGFGSYLVVGVSTAQVSMGANDYMMVLQNVEGWRMLRLAWGTASAQPLTIGFWSQHHRAGVYSVAIRNATVNRSYVTTYTQAAADVSQYNVVTIPGDVIGTWNKDNTIGMILSFAVACGSTLTAPSINTWIAGNYLAASGQVNAVGATADVTRITGVVVLSGIYAPTAAQSPLIMRSYDQELAICQRYFEWSAVGWYWYSHIPGEPMMFPTAFRAVKRVVPTMTNPVPDASSGGPTVVNVSSCVPMRASTDGCPVQAVATAAGSAYIMSYKMSADARL